MRDLCAGSARTPTRRPVRWCGAAPVTSTSAYEPARTGVRRREVDQSVLRGAGGEHRRVLLARSLDEDLLDHARRVAGWPPASCARSTMRSRAKRSAATCRSDEAVGHRRRLGSRARREDEREGVVEAGLGGDLERALEVVVGLAREADDDVGRHGEVGHDAPGVGEAGEVALGRVAAVHGGEHAIRAGLQRVVQLRAHRIGLGHRRERLQAHVLGVGRREPDPADAIDLAGGAQQVGEQRPDARRHVAAAASGELQVAPVAVDVLAEQRDLGDARRRPARSTSADDLVERTGDLHPADGRHDAERAVVVAPDLDRDPGVVGRLANRRERRREQRVVVDDGGVEDLRDRSRRAASRSAARWTLCVPMTTSTWAARSRTSSRSFWARQPETTI